MTEKLSADAYKTSHKVFGREEFSPVLETRMLTPVLLFAQVGAKRDSIRDDCRSLVVLPSPQAVSVLVPDRWEVLVLLLACSGDVETNPGPQTQEMLLPKGNQSRNNKNERKF